MPSPADMSLLQIARDVEDTIKAYVSVQQHTDLEAWRNGLLKEKVSTLVSLRAISIDSIFHQKKVIFAFQKARAKPHTKDLPTLHPTLAALCIVLDGNDDLTLITNKHPDLARHKYYSASAVFPDLSTLPLSTKSHWWEDLGASHIISFFHFLIVNT